MNFTIATLELEATGWALGTKQTGLLPKADRLIKSW